MTARHPCAGLPKRQREAFDRIAAGDDGFHHPATLRALMKRGLIERYGEHGIDGRFPVVIYRYSVPLLHHIAWCAWCGENVDDDQPAREGSTE